VPTISIKANKPSTKKRRKAYVTPWLFGNYPNMQGRLYTELGSRAERDYGGVSFAEGGEKKYGRSRSSGRREAAWTAAV